MEARLKKEKKKIVNMKKEVTILRNIVTIARLNAIFSDKIR